MEANTCENAYFHMTNYVLSKAATPMNSHFERTMFTSKFCMDFAMQNPYKVRSTHLDMSRYQFIQNFTLEVHSTAKSMQAFDANQQLSKYAARRTQYFKGIMHFQRQMFVKCCKLYM